MRKRQALVSDVLAEEASKSAWRRRRSATHSSQAVMAAQIRSESMQLYV